MLSLGFCQSVVLLVALPQIEEQSERHEPNLFLRQVEMRHAVIKKSSKQLTVAYSTFAFFGVSSLSTLRLVPRCIAAMIALLYSARSYGVVSSSTVSSVRSAF